MAGDMRGGKSFSTRSTFGHRSYWTVDTHSPFSSTQSRKISDNTLYICKENTHSSYIFHISPNMDLSDLRKIRRQLRQLRAKLYALSEAARETSYIRAPDINLVSSTTNVETLSSASSSSGTTFLDLRHPSAARVTVKYGKKGRRGGGMQSQARTNGTNGHGTTHNVSNLGLHRSDLNRLASPVRRQALGLHDCFKDVAEKVWNIGSSSKPSSRTSSPQKNLIKNTLSEVDTIYTVPSLAQLASFAVAKNIPVSEGEYDDEGLALEEEWYEVVPGHYRRYVF